MLRVYEMFTSINGEGPRSGQLANFIRFAGCNLHCSYCDTSYATDLATACFKRMTEDEIITFVKESGVKNVVLTGGEPLLQSPESLKYIIGELSKEGYQIDIETNGSVNIDTDLDASFILDYKLPSSGMERFMVRENFRQVRAKDVVKFVCGSERDLERAFEIIEEFDLVNKCSVYLSPVFGQLEPAQIVDELKKRKLNGPVVQLQIHKIIWDPELRGI